MKRPWHEPLLESYVPGRALLSWAPGVCQLITSTSNGNFIGHRMGALCPFLPWWVPSNGNNLHALGSTGDPLPMYPATHLVLPVLPGTVGITAESPVLAQQGQRGQTFLI